MHNYFTNYHTPTYFDTYRVILRKFVINTLPSYTSISNSAVGNTTYIFFLLVILHIFFYW